MKAGTAGEGRGRVHGERGWTDGHAKGARGCATTTPQPPANSAAARRSARSTGSNATTAYNTSPSRSPAVYLAAATLLRPVYPLTLSVSSFLSLVLFVSLSLSLLHPSSSLLLIITRRLEHPSTVIYMRTHSRDARISHSLSFSVCVSFSLSSRELTPRGIASDSQRTEAKRAASLPRCGTAAEERDVATPTSTPATTSLNALVAREQ